MKKVMQPIKMTRSTNQPADPLLPEHFFDLYDHAGAKEILWKWFVATVTEGYSACTPLEKENIVSFYERLSALLDGMNNSITAKSSDHHG